MVALYVIDVSGFTCQCCISRSEIVDIVHCRPFPHALMVVPYVMNAFECDIGCVCAPLKPYNKNENTATKTITIPHNAMETKHWFGVVEMHEETESKTYAKHWKP